MALKRCEKAYDSHSEDGIGGVYKLLNCRHTIVWEVIAIPYQRLLSHRRNRIPTGLPAHSSLGTCLSHPRRRAERTRICVRLCLSSLLYPSSLTA